MLWGSITGICSPILDNTLPEMIVSCEHHFGDFFIRWASDSGLNKTFTLYLLFFDKYFTLKLSDVEFIGISSCEIENKALYIEKKAKLLKTYKSYADELDGAESNFEEELVVEKREKLAKEIKHLASKIKEIESIEQQV
jgi:hypothetical protein